MAKYDVTLGGRFAAQLDDLIRQFDFLPLPGVRELPVLEGLTTNTVFDQLPENVIQNATELLVDSRRVFRYGNSIVMEADGLEGRGPTLVPLRRGATIEQGAASFLANVFVCQAGECRFLPRSGFVNALLVNSTTQSRLPRIRHYARRSIFNEEFEVCGPGWHPEDELLVHGPEIEPLDFSPRNTDLPALDRLPFHLRTMLGEFCFRDDASLVNTLALLLTGLLINHFTIAGKPVALLDGNQPGVGKTLLMRTIPMVLDGVDPRLIHFSPNGEELQKRICALLLEERQSIVLIDNAKVINGSCISSPALESNSMAPEISLRILGQSKNYSRPNDVLWAITMNDVRVSPDMVSRGLAVQLYFDGEPGNREFHGSNPVEYARENRLAILGELAGMVVHWCQQGSPNGSRGHRCERWAKVIGGILERCGFPEILSNSSVAAEMFNSELDELSALAETAISTGGEFVQIVSHTETPGEQPNEPIGALPRDWESIFRNANVKVDELDGSRRSKATKIGQFLGKHFGRETQVHVGDRTGSATLCRRECSGRAKAYYFRVVWDPTDEASDIPSGPTGHSGTRLDDGLEHLQNPPRANSPMLGQDTETMSGSGGDSPPTSGNDEDWE